MYDVSDPAAPEKVASVETPGRASRVSMNGDEVFVPDSEAGVSVVDVSDPAASALIGTFATPRPARDVSADGSLVAVVVGDSEREGHDRWVVLLGAALTPDLAVAHGPALGVAPPLHRRVGPRAGYGSSASKAMALRRAVRRGNSVSPAGNAFSRSM